MIGDLGTKRLGYSYREVRRDGPAGAGSGYITVAVPKSYSAKRYAAIISDLRGVFTDERTWFVSIDCVTGQTAGFTNRQANARFAFGAGPRKVSGLGAAAEVKPVAAAAP